MISYLTVNSTLSQNEGDQTQVSQKVIWTHYTNKDSKIFSLRLLERDMYKIKFL